MTSVRTRLAAAATTIAGLAAAAAPAVARTSYEIDSVQARFDGSYRTCQLFSESQRDLTTSWIFNAGAPEHFRSDAERLRQLKVEQLGIVKRENHPGMLYLAQRELRLAEGILADADRLYRQCEQSRRRMSPSIPGDEHSDLVGERLRVDFGG